MIQSNVLRQEEITVPSVPIDVPFYFQGLNSAQREAVEKTEGPVLVLAGAGTGKTRALTTRMVHLVHSGKAMPHQILVVTFTNKASREMRERIEKMTDYPVEGLWLGTFHSLCVRILRRHAERVHLNKSFTILDADDQLRLMKQILKAENVDEKRWAPRMVLSVINRWKDKGLTPEKVQETEQKQHRGENPIPALYVEYQNRLKVLNAVDFGDLILLCLELFTKAPDVLQYYQNQFRYILVDEYQDTNVCQYIWLRLLAQGCGNICCVGDEDQSIYGWRGAEITNILRFEKDFPGATVIRLEQNYRSSHHILGAASGLITKNKARLGKELWTDLDGGEKVKVWGLWDGEEEARVICDEIEAQQRAGTSLSEVAVLVRAGFQTRAFEERLMTLGIPYRVVGGLRFYERQEIRDALAYLRVVVQPNDGLAFERIINTPRRGIGTSTIQLLHQVARMNEISLFQAAFDMIQTDEIRGKTKTALKQILENFYRWRQTMEVQSAAELTQIVLDESGYTAMWQQEKSLDASARLENLKELVNAIKEFESLESFLEHVSLVAESNNTAESELVTVMTLHSAKGLEFDVVFLAGWEEGLFPHPRSMEENGLNGLEEERRLAYVGLTRARQRAYITHVANRQMHGKWQSAVPSRFIEELPAQHIEMNRKVLVRDSSFSNQAWRGQQNTLREGYEQQEAARIISSHKATFRPGDRVFHLKFGYGRIRAQDGDKLVIDFECSGEKKVFSGFVEKA